MGCLYIYTNKIKMLKTNERVCDDVRVSKNESPPRAPITPEPRIYLRTSHFINYLRNTEKKKEEKKKSKKVEVA